jgi:hypothetical protein
MAKKYLLLICVAVLCICCKKGKSKVEFESAFAQSNNVTIDDTINLKKHLSDKSYSSLQLSTGEHILKINNNSGLKFEVGDKGGLLNIDKKEFIVFPIEYKTEENNPIDGTYLNLPVIIDSLVIYQKSVAKNQQDLMDMLSDKKFVDMFRIGIRQNEKEQLFINKTWDYGIIDEMPETISIKTNSKYAEEEKYKIIDARVFKLFIHLDEDYHVEKINNPKLVDIVKAAQKTIAKKN